MKIAFVSSEVFPFIKTGGLADVSEALPKAIYGLGHNIKIFLPKYKQINNEKFNLKVVKEKLHVPIFNLNAKIFWTKLPGTDIDVYLIGNDKFYNRDQIYNDYQDNLERFAFFSLTVLELLKYLKYKPKIIHCNDWQSALIPVYLKTIYKKDVFFRSSRILFTIHNLGYQGIFDKSKYANLGLDKKYFHYKYLEFYDKINLLKGGIVFSDLLNTVSKTYSLEIQKPEFGFGLDGVLRERKADLYGILNGIDYDIWNPMTDPYIWRNYGINSIENKYYNKLKLQDINGLPKKDLPLISIISRLVSQKGLDLIVKIIDVLPEFDLQLVILGEGSKEYEEILLKASKDYPDIISANIEFNIKKAHQIEAGSDIFLMPSFYEPCGLNQMISLRYGTIPIVRKVGGLADSVKDIDEEINGNGFVFQDYTAIDLLKTIIRALKIYKNKNLWKKIIREGMQTDFSFKNSAKKYEKLYYKLITKL
ncbi:MAG: glycogen synthase GlgA [Candidatus Helarchaeota archaeon]